MLAAVAIVRLPGCGRTSPMRRSQVGTAKPAGPPGILLAAIATIFGSPVIGAIILVEATGLGGLVLPLCCAA